MKISIHRLILPVKRRVLLRICFVYKAMREYWEGEEGSTKAILERLRKSQTTIIQGRANHQTPIGILNRRGSYKYKALQ